MIDEEKFENFVYMQALENGVSFNGKANIKALIGKCIANFGDIKKDMEHYMKTIENIVNQVNTMSLDEQKNHLRELNPSFFEKKTEKRERKNNTELTELENVKGKVRMRFAPAPSGYLHIGHAYNIIYNHIYVKKYGGEFILRLEDTNPDNIKAENYEKVIEDIRWLTDDGIDEIYYQSERLSIYYKYLRQLVETGKAYVCKCELENFKEYNNTSQACPHRKIHIDEQVKEYEKMFDGKLKDGEAVVKFKADLDNKNPALRDFSIARINSSSHARVGIKYRVWPMYNLCTSIDDSLMGITHVIRGKDGEINAIRQDMLKDSLNLIKSAYYHIGKIKFTDVILSKTELAQKIENREYEGWDDPRVPTLLSYRKRGYRSGAFRNMIVAGGISKRDSKISEEEYQKSLNFFNRQILEKEADRYFFVHNPKRVHIMNVDKYSEKEILLPKHPEYRQRGSRHFKVEDEYLIDGIDFDNIEKGDIIRLMHFANFKVNQKEKNKLEIEIISKEFDKELKLKRNIHFLPMSAQKCIVILQNNSRLKGICEHMDNIKENTNLQFERFGFVKYDRRVEETRVFYFTHR